MQLVGDGDIDGTQLLPWQQQHQGSVAALDICTENAQVPRLYMQCMKAAALGASPELRETTVLLFVPRSGRAGLGYAHSMLTVLTWSMVLCWACIRFVQFVQVAGD